MTKPLHVQLRETKPSECIRSSLSGLTNINPPCGDRLCKECTKEQLDALADRIENEYILRPRYEDDEIIQFDSVVNDKLRGDMKVDRISFTRSGFYFGASHNAKGERIVEKIRYDYGEPIKRSDSPVLDVDGVEIKVGDKVWCRNNGAHCEVVNISDNGVLDIKWLDSSGMTTRLAAHCFTHQEPDSFTKAMERFQSILEDKDGLDHETEDKLWKIHKRLTALIERGME